MFLFRDVIFFRKFPDNFFLVGIKAVFAQVGFFTMKKFPHFLHPNRQVPQLLSGVGGVTLSKDRFVGELGR